MSQEFEIVLGKYSVHMLPPLHFKKGCCVWNSERLDLIQDELDITMYLEGSEEQGIQS